MNVNYRPGFDVPLKVASPALAFESFIGAILDGFGEN